ncbi:hypothetical protein [Aporhodopirellula aestuarii]|uniref:Uncharacterized protein n=1 Tax=Aporhodopirellula aestuarii TaxID=2950107 RepID=A0ABT0U506_9BACT|nr:hypothetical protein [Aporhodopirellula aestuarii]MCM2371528.1 hypothetical protein [Aporhodopirellula aestuarii]
MSSNRQPMPSHAIVTHSGRPVGPMMLPANNGDSFVEEFNRTYRSIGLTVTLNEHGRPLVSQVKGLHSPMECCSPGRADAIASGTV